MAEPKRMTKAQIISEMAERTGLSKKEVGTVFDELRNLIQKELGDQGPGEFVLPELIKLRVKKVPAQPATKRKNPFTGEEVDVPAKGPSVKVRATPLKKLKDLVN